MTKILFVFLGAATLTITAFSQTQNQPENAPACNLSLSQAPAIRGIRLGMEHDEWLKLFPGSAQDPQLKARLDRSAGFPTYGLTSIAIGPALSNGPFNYLPEGEFSGVGFVNLTLFDKRIVGYLIEYAPEMDIGNPWEDVTQLIPIFSKPFNLPQVSAWDKNGAKATLRCNGFELSLTAKNPPQVSLKLTSDFNQTIRQREAADRQKHRAAFKP